MERPDDALTESDRLDPLLPDATRESARVSVRGRITDVEHTNVDGQNLQGRFIKVCRFTDVSFKAWKLSDCTFSHCIFERCYFRTTELKRVIFNGCHFRDCNFDKAIFMDCSLEYSEFQNCSLTYPQVAPCLDRIRDRANVLRDLARSLRLNAQQRGQIEDSRKFMDEELRASVLYNKNKAFAWNHPYFGKKYRFEDRLTAAWDWLKLGLGDFIWGHGERPLRVLRLSAIVITLFAYVYWKALALTPGAVALNGWDALGLSAATFATASYGNITATKTTERSNVG